MLSVCLQSDSDSFRSEEYIFERQNTNGTSGDPCVHCAATGFVWVSLVLHRHTEQINFFRAMLLLCHTLKLNQPNPRKIPDACMFAEFPVQKIWPTRDLSVELYTFIFVPRASVACEGKFGFDTHFIPVSAAVVQHPT